MNNFSFYDLQPKISNFRDEVLAGLSKQQKQIPPKFFYDDYGSKIFDQICELEEYYPTRTEFSILQQHCSDIADQIGENSLVIEYGSGSSQKICLLLDSLMKPLAYMPIDISREHMLSASKTIADKYPDLEVLAVCADYTTEMLVPDYDHSSLNKKVIFFPGTTIGNLEPEQAVQLLKRSAAIVGSGGGMLIGFDMKKDPQILHAAYNDAKGVTAAFNVNLLTRINKELEADFDTNKFAHYAFFNLSKSRIEMHLVSLAEQIVIISGQPFSFSEGESIYTENSYKFSMREIKNLSEGTGFKLSNFWTDPENHFYLCYLLVN
ncbi:L-histidine N(alpha)-methyltransferase [Spirulina sp. CCNP1310]|uniref:L-histidine N(alpha)-methyltransferase n=1 Tax=Spirulina sp. CCNP1310 TaxID=3110249 RepID=UPI002B21060A|nr:L-histidine N(alpha)-methyltransferase [Spirulina sp. CCNP1310]MEA5419829.1 L-histidine N(alpha)-methyltransferase [Spirulina sp. CCNP1310]